MCPPTSPDCSTVEYMVFEYDVLLGNRVVSVRCQTCEYCLDMPFRARRSLFDALGSGSRHNSRVGHISSLVMQLMKCLTKSNLRGTLRVKKNTWVCRPILHIRFHKIGVTRTQEKDEVLVWKQIQSVYQFRDKILLKFHKKIKLFLSDIKNQIAIKG